MDNYKAIVVDNDTKAFETLHGIWRLYDNGGITVHGAAVIDRDRYGFINVATKDTDPGLRTLVGVGIGVLLGALAGPIGAAAGASIATGAAIGAGAAAGGVAGLTADAFKAEERDQAEAEADFVLPHGKSAVIAEVSEDSTTPIDTLAKQVGGKVFRRSKGDVQNDAFFDPSYGEYLYPYDYERSSKESLRT